MLLIAGLGNPGKQYINTRHNVGFMAVDYLSSRHGLSWSEKPKFNSEITQTSLSDHKLLFVKPTTYMNLSGSAVQSLSSYYKIKSEQIFVIHDDVDLEIGKVKFKLGGGNGGHNGLKSIDNAIGNNYYRIRVGIGRPENKEVSDYVLGQFSSEEYATIVQAIKIVADNFDLVLSNKLEEFKQILHSAFG